MSKWQQVFPFLGSLPKPKFPQFLRFRYNRQRAVLLRVAQVIHGRIDTIELDWAEAIEDGCKPDTFYDIKHRSRVREINAILVAIQREFPGVEIPLGAHPCDVRDNAVNATTTPQTPQLITNRKVGP